MHDYVGNLHAVHTLSRELRTIQSPSILVIHNVGNVDIFVQLLTQKKRNQIRAESILIQIQLL